MADIKNLKIGGENPDAIMFARPYQPMANQFMYFGSLVPKSTSGWGTEAPAGEWEINDDWGVEFVTTRKLLIKKFKIDTWGIRRKWSSATKADYANNTVRVTGITYLNGNVIKANADNLEEVTGFVPAYGTSWGTVWYPGQNSSGKYVQGLVVTGCGIYTESFNQYGDASYDFNRDSSYGIRDNRDHTINDGVIPPGMGVNNAHGICIGIFGGVQNATDYMDNSNGAYRVYDISDHPLTIDLDVVDASAAIDYSSVESWDAYIGDTQVYHKDKTIDNCLKKYKYVKEVATDDFTAVQIVKDISFGNNIIVPVPVDFENLFGNSERRVSFNINASNGDFWNAVKQHASNIGMYLVNTDYDKINGTFQNSNIDGAITIKVLNGENIAAERMFENTLLSEINFTYVDDEGIESNNRFTSLNTLFKSTPNLKTITTTYLLQGRDMSGCFEYSGIEKIPGIINYASMALHPMTIGEVVVMVTDNLTAYYCDGCSNLTKIDRCSESSNDRFSGYNVITAHSGHYMFNSCNKLLTIDPVLDIRYVRPNDAQNMFNNCTALADVRVKGLNHGNWHFDGSTSGDGIVHGNLISLDKDSIEYLFANLIDLTARDPDLVYDGSNGNAVAANPAVDSANLYCPSSWQANITSEMISAANAKGWHIYVGDEELTAGEN